MDLLLENLIAICQSDMKAIQNHTDCAIAKLQNLSENDHRKPDFMDVIVALEMIQTVRCQINKHLLKYGVAVNNKEELPKLGTIYFY